MSNRQARREANRKSRQRAANQRSSGPGGGQGGGGLGPFEFLKSPFTLGAIALAAGLFGVIIFLALTSGDEGTSKVEDLAEAHANFPNEMADGLSVGSEDSPLQITMYEDFQCPFCLRFTVEDEPIIIEEYVKSGRVRLTFMSNPILGAESVLAAKGGICAAEQNRFWDYQNRLFTIQAEAGQIPNERLNVGRFTEPELSKVAADLGMDQAAFEACQGNPDSLEEVDEQRANALALGLGGTPAFVFNGQPRQGPSGAQAWRDLLDDFLAELETPDEPTATEAPSGDSGPTGPTAEPTTE